MVYVITQRLCNDRHYVLNKGKKLRVNVESCYTIDLTLYYMCLLLLYVSNEESNINFLFVRVLIVYIDFGR